MRPRKIVLDFQKGQAVGPVSDDLKADVTHEGNKDFVGELSVTLVDARKLAYVIFGTVLLSLLNLNSFSLICNSIQEKSTKSERNKACLSCTFIF